MGLAPKYLVSSLAVNCKVSIVVGEEVELIEAKRCTRKWRKTIQVDTVGGQTSTGAGCVTPGSSAVLQAAQYNVLLSALTTCAFSPRLNKAPRPVFHSCGVLLLSYTGSLWHLIFFFFSCRSSFENNYSTWARIYSGEVHSDVSAEGQAQWIVWVLQKSCVDGWMAKCFPRATLTFPLKEEKNARKIKQLQAQGSFLTYCYQVWGMLPNKVGYLRNRRSGMCILPPFSWCCCSCRKLQRWQRW